MTLTEEQAAKLTPRQREVLGKVLELGSQAAAAIALGVCFHSVMDVLRAAERRLGLKVPRARGGGRTARIDDNAVVRRYQAGASLEDVAAAYGVSKSTIHRHIEAWEARTGWEVVRVQPTAKEEALLEERPSRMDARVAKWTRCPRCELRIFLADAEHVCTPSATAYISTGTSNLGAAA